MLARLLGPKHCTVHGRPLEREFVPVRYGLIRFREEYRKAATEQFPHTKKFVLGGCRVGRPREQEVMFCPECRAAESRWHEENPDFDDPSNVQNTITIARRDLPDSLAKRILKQSQLEKPERAERYLWIVYRLSLNECIAYNAEQKTYYYPYANCDSQSYSSISDIADALNMKFDA